MDNSKAMENYKELERKIDEWKQKVLTTYDKTYGITQPKVIGLTDVDSMIGDITKIITEIDWE